MDIQFLLCSNVVSLYAFGGSHEHDPELLYGTEPMDCIHLYFLILGIMIFCDTFQG